MYYVSNANLIYDTVLPSLPPNKSPIWQVYLIFKLRIYLGDKAKMV